ncbi:unnamed protein product [Effrenium voratum]|uniref:Uncharacterized protein n=1 Tax=Effrenium voratum TaxID=2562239 RepID=A0AA36HXH5_9DINO|nr:unnamed protein product [Effrenium voratum]
MANASAPPRRVLDTVQRENFADLVEPSRRSLVKVLEFSFEGQSISPKEVEVVLFDIYSLDSFAAACAARSFLGQGVHYEGVTRNGYKDIVDTNLEGKVVAMLGVCWKYMEMKELIQAENKILVLDSQEDSLTEDDINELGQYGSWIMTQPHFGAGVMAWEFFNRGKKVPLILRAIEDAHLGRRVFKDADALEDGIDALLEDVDITAQIRELNRAVVFKDELFLKFEEVLKSSQLARERVQAAISKGSGRRAEISKHQQASSSGVVRVFRHFPAWKCNVVIAQSKFEGRIAERLAQDLAQRCPGSEERCLGIVMDLSQTGVRVTLRSLDGGPPVAQIARHFGGCGSAMRAFFKKSSGSIESMFEQPEVMLRDVKALSCVCLSLSAGDLVTVMRRGEHHKESPMDDWSWGFKVHEPHKEGWLPTLSYSVYVAIFDKPSPGQGVEEVKEGDLVVAKVQRGSYAYGSRLPRGPIEALEKSWFPFDEDLFKRVHPSSVAAILEEAGFFTRKDIFA